MHPVALTLVVCAVGDLWQDGQCVRATETYAHCAPSTQFHWRTQHCGPLEPRSALHACPHAWDARVNRCASLTPTDPGALAAEVVPCATYTAWDWRRQRCVPEW